MDTAMDKIYDCGGLLGRFHTYHIGHENLVNQALKLCDRVVIFVGSAQECGTERNPFNIATRISMLEAIYGKNNPRVIIKALSDLSSYKDITFDWGRYVLDNYRRYIYKSPDMMVFGEEESNNRWFSPEDSSDMLKLYIPRTRINISATELRDMMLRDDRENWQKWVNPKLHKLYDVLRAELLSVPTYKDKLIRERSLDV